MTSSLRGGALQVLSGHGKDGRPQQVNPSKPSANGRVVGLVIRREAPKVAGMSWSMTWQNYSPEVYLKRTNFLRLYSGLERSSSVVEKKCQRVARRKGSDEFRRVDCASNYAIRTSSRSSSHNHPTVQESLYGAFVDYAVQQCSQRMVVKPYPVKEEFRELVAKDGKAITTSTAFKSDKIRNFRAAVVNGYNSIQVLNLVAFPSTAYDIPVFCADLVSFAKKSVIVLDVASPLYNSLHLPRQYNENYVNSLQPIWKKYSDLLPWGGEVTSEALQFFSPFVIWSRPIKDETVDDSVFAAFKDYLHVWLDLVDKAEATKDIKDILQNQAAQHRYMTWRSAKDPGRPLLTRLYGETQCEEYMKEFLFAELDNMGTKSFLDYFPQFKDPNGSIQRQRSVSGKAFRTRPWDENGDLLLSSST